jgi:RHS repeat-associated protein
VERGKSKSNGNELYLNSTPIATITPKGIYRIYADHLDTSRRVATNNEKAEVLWSWESKPFGESEANSDVDGNGEIFTLNLRFPGQYFDGETSTHYNINRDYNPVTGRYIQSDPIGFDGGVNSFGYVGGNPILLVDKNGKFIQISWPYWFLSAVAYSNPIGWVALGVTTAVVAGVAIYEYHDDGYWGDNSITYYFAQLLVEK